MLTTGQRKAANRLETLAQLEFAEGEAEPVSGHERPKERAGGGCRLHGVALLDGACGEQLEDGGDAAIGGAGLSGRRPALARLPMASAAAAVAEKFDEGRGQIFFRGDAQRVVIAQVCR